MRVGVAAACIIGARRAVRAAIAAGRSYFATARRQRSRIKCYRLRDGGSREGKVASERGNNFRRCLSLVS